MACLDLVRMGETGSPLHLPLIKHLQFLATVLSIFLLSFAIFFNLLQYPAAFA